jgi:integrase
VPGVLVRALATHLQQFPAEGEGFVFTLPNGEPVRRARLNESWNRAVAAAGMPATTYFHDLRHTYASLLIEAGESIKVVSARLGHASAVETLETYSHLWPDSDEGTVRRLDLVYEQYWSQSAHGDALQL